MSVLVASFVRPLFEETNQHNTKQLKEDIILHYLLSLRVTPRPFAVSNKRYPLRKTHNEHRLVNSDAVSRVLRDPLAGFRRVSAVVCCARRMYRYKPSGLTCWLSHSFRIGLEAKILSDVCSTHCFLHLTVSSRTDSINPVKIVIHVFPSISPWHVGTVCLGLMSYIVLSDVKNVLYWGVSIFFRSILSIFFRNVEVIGRYVSGYSVYLNR
jgi:hypothetical protein